VRSPLHSQPLIQLDTVNSTQSYAGDHLRRGEPVGAVLAMEQTAGRGRFDRTWHSPPGECLAVSLVFTDYANHPRPYLIGMALAVAAAQAFDANVRWPNDIVIGERKLGGILTELLPDAKGIQVPVVGVGINLNQSQFPPDISDLATSVRLAHGHQTTPEAALTSLLAEFTHLGEIKTWQDLAPHWMKRDTTPAKKYRLHDGRESIAIGIGSNGELECEVDGVRTQVLAADALMTG
jgi:BirA family biotin operon repressor/biotin-[acetyl-CoA-carboxylase] ligase